MQVIVIQYISERHRRILFNLARPTLVSLSRR